jgi:hypothetical protein
VKFPAQNCAAWLCLRKIFGALALSFVLIRSLSEHRQLLHNMGKEFIINLMLN